MTCQQWVLIAHRAEVVKWNLRNSLSKYCNGYDLREILAIYCNLKPTTKIAVTRYTAYKRSGCERLDDRPLTPGLRLEPPYIGESWITAGRVQRGLDATSMFTSAEMGKLPYRYLSMAVVGNHMQE